MRILPIALLFILNIIGTQSECHYLNDFWCGLWNQVFGDNDETTRKDVMPAPVDNCKCVQVKHCYEKDISNQLKCIDTDSNDVNHNFVCCRNPVRFTTVRPPPNISDPTKITTQQPKPLNATKMSSQRPESTTQSPPKISTNAPPARIPLSTPSTRVPSLTSTQIPITNPPTQTRPAGPQPQDKFQGSTITNTDCTCMPLSECNDEDLESNSQYKQQGSCLNTNDVCCLGLVQPVTSQPPQQPSPSSISTKGQTLVTSRPSQSPSPTQASPPADSNCTCTPFYKCYDEETSSNLTGVVNDRTHTIRTTDLPPKVYLKMETCPDPNDVCCHNLVKITAKPAINSSSVDCIGSCIFIKECPYLLNKLDEAQGGNSDAIEELRSSVCSITDEGLQVCCPPKSVGTTKTPSPMKPFYPKAQDSNNQTSTAKPSLESRPLTTNTQYTNGIQPSTPASTMTIPQKPTTKPSLQSESPITSQSSPAFMNECVCTPFFNCYDNETSSNLTGVVNDRMIVPSCKINEKNCSEPNDICCCSLEPPPSPSTVQSQLESHATNCSGSCIPIEECPGLSATLKEARKSDKGAILKLRNSVCSNANGTLKVCCPQIGAEPTPGIIFPED